MDKRKDKLLVKKEIKKAITQRIKDTKKQQLEDKLEEVERMKNDSSRYFAALKQIKRTRTQNKIVVTDIEGKTAATEGEQIGIITEHFKKMLAPESGKENIIQYHLKEMRIPFTNQEIANAAKKLKNGRSAGPDEVDLELIKYAPTEIHSEISNIFNRMSRTGEPITELVLVHLCLPRNLEKRKDL